MALIKKPVTGMKDILPAEMLLRDYCISVIKKTYAEFGFTSIETPCVESLANLNSKQGGENAAFRSSTKLWIRFSMTVLQSKI